jgi:hypothetical protein
MKTYEIDAKVGAGGVLTLERLPFANGQAVRVRIEGKLDSPSATGPRVLGLHRGQVSMSDDFDEPLPESFWLGENGGDEASA